MSITLSLALILTHFLAISRAKLFENMGFNSVYQTLKELFPQVDARLLKAVAIEHAKDPDGAVESILTEVLPFTCGKSNVATTIVKNNEKLADLPSSSTLDSVAGKDTNDSRLLNDAHNIDDDSLASSFYDANDTDDMHNGFTRNEDLMSLTRSEETVVEAIQAETLGVTSGNSCTEYSKGDCVQAIGDYESETFIPSRDCQDRRTDVHVNKSNEVSSSTINTEYAEADLSLNDHWDVNQDCIKDAPGFDYHQEQQSFNLLGYRISTDQASVSVTEREAENGMPFTDGDNNDMCNYVNADFMQVFPGTDCGAEGETALSTIVTHSGQICRISLVKDIIEDAKNYKDVLLSATESILRLIEDVEHKEKEAEQYNAAAARGGLDILEKVEEMKKMLKHAKEANEMHAGEVYGEKSILATEVRELQTRLFGLADEKDKSLAILDEMRGTLEARLAASEEERKAAEKEMLEKQETARVALAEQELVMEKVVQESKLLQQEAEENAKLRDFLMEKGRVVDEMQGEISVICQDVKLLKENFDKRVSLSKSLSIEQTSFRMASSTSSGKSMASDPATGHMELLATPRKISQPSSVEGQTPKSNAGEEAVGSGATSREELLDGDWELFNFVA